MKLGIQEKLELNHAKIYVELTRIFIGGEYVYSESDRSDQRRNFY